MKYRICISALLLWAGMQLSASNNQKEVVIKIIETSDVHGNFFPYNFIERKEWSLRNGVEVLPVFIPL